LNTKNAALLLVAILAVSSFLAISIKSVVAEYTSRTRVSTTGNLKVIVQDKDGVVIAGASVSSSSQPNGQPALSGTTGTDGIATFFEILPGTYTLQASKVGYVSGSAQWNVASGSTGSIGITLQGQSSGGGGVPGFPYETVAIGILLTIWITLSRAKRRTA
jgi:hypothetical protein